MTELTAAALSYSTETAGPEVWEDLPKGIAKTSSSGLQTLTTGPALRAFSYFPCSIWSFL